MSEFRETNDLPKILVTAVGSLPHTDPGRAVNLIESSLRLAPHVPQLPRLDLREQMWTQFVENLPCFVLDTDNLNYYFDTSGDSMTAVEAFYENYLAVVDGRTADYFQIGPRFGGGIRTFFESAEKRPQKLPFAKTQVTGPLSFGMTVTDETRKPIFYHSVFRDVIVKGMGLKALWLIEQCKRIAERVIVFFDEPSLSAYGSSAFLGVSKTDVVATLTEVMEMVLDRGGVPGIHCCGNTDWGMLMETPVRIINFDAVDYMHTMGIYARELAKFIGRGGVLAWGAVPNTERVLEENTAIVYGRLRDGLDVLERSGVDRGALQERVVITPACGCAGLNESTTEAVYGLLSQIERETSLAGNRGLKDILG